MICVIMRGFPGSGKSYTAKQICSEGTIISTDNYWIPESIKKRASGKTVDAKEELNEYRKNWNPKELGKAHGTTFKLFEDMLNKGVNPIIVDNTNVQLWNMENYIKSAKSRGYEVFIMEPTSPWWLEYSPYLGTQDKKLDEFADILYKKNSHGVPKETIRKMIDKWDHLDEKKVCS